MKKSKKIKKTTKLSKVEELLLAALGSEIMAMEFYNKAAEKALSKMGKEFFSELAEFELSHYDHVKKIILAYNKNAKLELYKPMVLKKSVKPEVSGEFEPNKDEIVDVMNIAIKAEEDAMTRYLDIAKKMKDKETKQIFVNLSEDERRHRNLLENQFYQLSNKGTIIWE